MERLDRAAPLPKIMQGHWVDAEDPTALLLVDGGEVEYQGRPINYDYKIVGEQSSALTVDFKIVDQLREDSFQRENLIGLVIDFEGNFLGFNVKFGCRFVRQGDV